MSFPFFVAKRYLFSKKKHHAINLISYIAMLGVAVGTLALVVVLSAFNGLEELVQSLYSNFDPELRIEAAQGKTFTLDSVHYQQIKQHPEVQTVCPALEESVMLKYGENQVFGTLKGVDTSFVRMSELESFIWTGSSTLLTYDEREFMVLGYLLARDLKLNLGDVFTPLQVYAADRKASKSVSVENAFLSRKIYPSGIFAVNAEFDSKYMLVPLRFAAELLQRENEITSYEIQLKPKANAQKVKSDLQTILGESYSVKTRYELNEMLYKTNNIEKWATFMILVFILLIATFNIIGSITMLIIDKKQDIFILSSMGANAQNIRSIFFWEGMLIALVGGGIGMTLGLILCWLQMQFSLLTLEGMLVDAYPISIYISDLIAIAAIVFFIGLLAAWLPAKWVVKRYITQA